MDRSEWTHRDHARAKIVEDAVERLRDGAKIADLTDEALMFAEFDLGLLVLEPPEERDGKIFRGADEKRHSLSCAVAREIGRRQLTDPTATARCRALRSVVRERYRSYRPDLDISLI